MEDDNFRIYDEEEPGSRPFSFTLIILSAAAMLIACGLFLVMATGVVWAHSWYTTTRDPVTDVSCCGGYDCDEISHDDVRETTGGYTYVPTGEFIPMDRVQPSRDWKFHRCEFLASFTYRGQQMEKGKTRCFFAPPGSS